MKRFHVLAIIVIFLTPVIPGTCFPDSMPAQERGEVTVEGSDTKQDKDTTKIQEKNRGRNSIEKTKDLDRKEPAYDMDFEVDPEDERC